ncbi:MAG: GHKL domain-containing protein [Ruminococcaceae bacterium]|nr:GHKL domain-containing protein [Oscillospiraceae bacterium]
MSLRRILLHILSVGCIVMGILLVSQTVERLKGDTLLLGIGLGSILLGLGLLLLDVDTLTRENRRAAVELKRMKERQSALEAISKQTRELAHHQRLETIGTLTSSIAHEFNNLLTPIMSYSLLTLERLPAEEEELYDNVLEIYNASQKAKVIISRLSDLSRKNSPRTIHEVSTDELVQKALDIALPAKPEKVEVKLNLNCWDLRILANEIQICQLFLNLMLNAFSAMEHGGTLQIDSTYDDDRVRLRFKDTGCGIPQALQKKIFDPFFTTKEPGKGTGLGLAIVAQVLEEHKGDIQLQSTPGEGSTFTVSFPRVNTPG